MERVYHEINEELARRAKSMMSFDDYKDGSKTAEYRQMCDEVYDLAEKVIKERQDVENHIVKLAQRYAKKMADNFNQDSSIACRCPSILISGGGNFPIKKKEKQVTAWEKNHAEYNEIQKIKDKIESIYYGKDIIKSGDADAVEKLENKIETAKALQDKMKAANKAIRLKDIDKGNERLRDLGFNDRQIADLRTPDFCGRIGFPDYELRNNNANIHRLEGRLKQILEAKDKGTQETTNKFCRVVENTEIMRLQLFFEDKPEANVRDILKRHGFRWSPKNMAWQRQLNNNGRSAMESVIRELQELSSNILPS